MSAQSDNTKRIIELSANDAIARAFQEYVESGGKGVCEFRDSFIAVINDHMSSQKGLLAQNKSTGAQWRQDIKNHFSGRGRKWIAVPLEVGLSALEGLVAEGVESAIKTSEDFRRQGFAWVRFYSPAGSVSDQKVRCDVWYQGSSVVLTDLRVDLPWEDVQTYDILTDTPRRLGFEEEIVSKEAAQEDVGELPTEEELDKTTAVVSIDDIDDLDATFADLVNSDQ